MDSMTRYPADYKEDPIDRPTRKTIPVRMSADAHAKMERIRARRGLSQSRYIEALINKDK